MAFYRRFLFISGSLGLRKVLVQLFQSAGRFLSVIGIIIKDGTEDNEIDEVTLVVLPTWMLIKPTSV